MVFASVKSGENLTSFIVNANLCTILFAAIYSASMAVYARPHHVIYSGHPCSPEEAKKLD